MKYDYRKGEIARCDEHGKKLWATRSRARQVARQHYGRHKTVYRCTSQPDFWHVGELSRQIVAGTYTRSEFYHGLAA